MCLYLRQIEWIMIYIYKNKNIFINYQNMVKSFNKSLTRFTISCFYRCYYFSNHNNFWSFSFVSILLRLRELLGKSKNDLYKLQIKISFLLKIGFFIPPLTQKFVSRKRKLNIMGLLIIWNSSKIMLICEVLYKNKI